MKRIRVLPGLVILLLVSGPALGKTCCPDATDPTFFIQDINSTAEFSYTTQHGMFSWVVDGTEHMCQQWFWYRIGDSAKESIDTLTYVIGGVSDPDFDNDYENVYLKYAGAGFEIEVNFRLLGGQLGSNASDMSEVISIHNTG